MCLGVPNRLETVKGVHSHCLASIHRLVSPPQTDFGIWPEWTGVPPLELAGVGIWAEYAKRRPGEGPAGCPW